MTFLLTQWKFVLIAALLAMLGVQQVRISHAQTELAKVRQQYAEERQKAADAARKAEQDARDEETRREQIKEEIIDAAEQRVELAKAAAADADSAAAGLRERLAAHLAASRGSAKNSGPGKGSEGKPSADTLDLLAGVLSRLDDTSGDLAAYADRLVIAGLACERQYESLRSPAKP